MVCGPAPVGQARWSVRLIATEAVRRKLVSQVGRETIRMLLEATTSNRGGEKMWCVAQLDEAFIERLEDVLKVYERPLTAKEPVVCPRAEVMWLLERLYPKYIAIAEFRHIYCEAVTAAGAELAQHTG